MTITETLGTPGNQNADVPLAPHTVGRIAIVEAFHSLPTEEEPITACTDDFLRLDDARIRSTEAVLHIGETHVVVKGGIGHIHLGIDFLIRIGIERLIRAIRPINRTCAI
jgi:hypothetical protein